MNEEGRLGRIRCVNKRMGDRGLEVSKFPHQFPPGRASTTPSPFCQSVVLPLYLLPSVQLYILSKYALANLSRALGFDINVKWGAGLVQTKLYI